MVPDDHWIKAKEIEAMKMSNELACNMLDSDLEMWKLIVCFRSAGVSTQSFDSG